MKLIVLIVFICLFVEGKAQRTESFTFYLENGVNRRVEGIRRSKTISFTDLISGNKQRNRYDSWVNSIGFSYDLRKDPNKGFSAGLEIKHQFSQSDLQFRTQSSSSFGSVTLYSFDQKLSLWAIGPRVRGTGKMLEGKKYRLNYIVGGEMQIHIASKEFMMEFRKHGSNSYSAEFIELSELVESTERIQNINLYWFSFFWGIELKFKTEKKLKWGIRLYNDLWSDSSTAISLGGSKWNYSDETGIGLIIRY